MVKTAPAESLAERYDLLVFDLDGVLYVGEEPVPQASAAVAWLREHATQLCYVTNNASRRADTVAELLTRLAVPAEPAEVLTSAQASAEFLGGKLPAGASVLVIGAPALAEEIATVGLTPVRTADERPVAVVQGFGPEVGWRQLAEAAVALAAGAELWVATNTDLTVPSPRGPLPGNGALVAGLAAGLGRRPDVVVGKPEPGLFIRAVQRFGAQRPLVVGDRLDTDVAGAVRAGFHSVLVFTGVSGPADILAARSGERPTYLARDLTDLLRPYPEVTATDGGTRCRDWNVRQLAGRLELDGTGDPLDALRALCTALWGDADERNEEPVGPVGRVAAPDSGPATRTQSAAPGAVTREAGVAVPVVAVTSEAARALSDLGLSYSWEG